MNQRRTAALCAIVSLAAVSVLAAPVIAGFKAGDYVGTSSQVDQVDQRLNVGFEIPRNKNKVNIVYFEFLNIDCNKVTQIAGESVKIKDGGKFSLKPADPVFASGYVKGKFKGREASGTAEFPDRCPSAGVIEWEAEKD